MTFNQFYNLVHSKGPKYTDFRAFAMIRSVDQGLIRSDPGVSSYNYLHSINVL